MLGAAAAATERISIGFGVMLLSLRPAVWAAKQISTPQLVSGDRLLLGVGTGNPVHGDVAAGAEIAQLMTTLRRRMVRVSDPPARRDPRMLRGLATISYFADDLAAAKAWYTDLLGVEAYYAFPHEGPPAYVEFRIGDYQHELGLIDRKYAPHGTTAGPAGTVAFWHVDDLPAAMERLRAMGATVHEKITEREDGFVTASVIDPFGNILGVMYNPHYLEILQAIKGA